MRDYPNILVAFLEELEAGYEFERWPHHITILPWFKSDRRAITDVASISKRYLPIQARLGGTEMFGVRSDVLVRLVESEDLGRFHQALLTNRGGVLGLANSRHTLDNFHPHITLQGQNDPILGSSLHIERITLVKKINSGKTKRVVWSVG